MKLDALFQRLSLPLQEVGVSYPTLLRAIYQDQAKQLALYIDQPVDASLEEKWTRDLTEAFSCPVLFHVEVADGFYGAPFVVSPMAQEKRSDIGSSWSIGRFPKKEPPLLSLSDLDQGTGPCMIEGFLMDLETVTTKNRTVILSFILYDWSGATGAVKMFVKASDLSLLDNLAEGHYVQVRGKVQYDSYQKSFVFMAQGLRPALAPIKEDPAPRKRIELALHTQMSNMEGLIEAQKLPERLKEYGMEAVGITDRGNLQAYPLVQFPLPKAGIKVLYGLHAKILSDQHKILSHPYQKEAPKTARDFTVFDIETTGFSHFQESIIEIGAVRIRDGQKIGEFSSFIRPPKPIPARITELTSITDAMVADAAGIDQVLPKFLAFAQGSILVAHNADFDVGFISENAYRLGLPFEPVYLDTLGLSRALHPDFKNHKLDTICKNLNVPDFHHHRAIDDAKATAEAFLVLLAEFQAGALPFDQINQLPSAYPLARHEQEELLIYVAKQNALKGLYEMVSDSNMTYFWRSPGILASDLKKHHEGLLYAGGFIGSALFEAVSRRYPEAYLMQLIEDLDFIVVQPPCFAEWAIHEELAEDRAHFIAMTRTLIDLAKKSGKCCCAVGMPTYLDPGERLARNILVNYQRNLDFDTNGRLQLKTTSEMLREFSYLPQALAEEIVIDNPHRMADAMESIVPIPKGTFTPKVEGSDEQLRALCDQNVRALYGTPLPPLVEKRLEKELSSIISNGYSPLYVIAERLVKKSNEDGYMVGSRGSVGSSFVATAAGITEVNPLPPHYVCPHCKHVEFITDGSVGSGFDLPEKACPECGTMMRRDGQEIPFEVFLGFDGDKEPDIDLNFAGVYMPTIHKYTEKLFGKGKVFRAGTVSGVQEKTAYGLIKKYQEAAYIPEEDRRLKASRIQLLKRQMEGTRRTTGQHAGGLIIIPQDKDVTDFTPIQYPADDPNRDVITTHFSYKFLEEQLLKLDELGHTTPTIIRQLQEMTGIDPLSIPFNDPKTMALFSSADSLDIQAPYSNDQDGSLGIPEFGTDFVRGMLKDTKPRTFADLIRIAGLSHGTDVWLNNAQELIRKGTIDLSRAICTRDDIMINLISMGMDKSEAFQIMEKVRKGKGIPDALLPHMRDHQVPEWFIESCQKIKYMFPKAHAAAYVMMSFRIAWFKVHSPAAFYATYLTQRLADFSSAFLFESLSEVQEGLEALKRAEEPDKNKITLVEVIEEMFARGLSFAPIDLLQSAGATFRIEGKHRVLPPLAALDAVSEATGRSIERERARGPFLSKKDFQKRTGINRAGMESLEERGLLDAYPRSNQMSFLSGF